MDNLFEDLMTLRYIVKNQSRMIDEFKSQLAHTEALLDRDGTNTNLPTSQTPPGKKNTSLAVAGVPGRKKADNPDMSAICLRNHLRMRSQIW